MFTDPVKNLKAFGLKDDNIVADLGAGTGHYSIVLGEMVPRGKVYAVELVKDFLETLKSKIKDSGLKNVEVLWGDVETPGGTHIGDGVVDVAIVSNLLFQIEHKDKFIVEVNRILKKEGKVLLVDWMAESPGVSTRATVPKDKARAMFERAGFNLKREIDAGAHHYGMILEKNDER